MVAGVAAVSVQLASTTYGWEALRVGVWAAAHAPGQAAAPGGAVGAPPQPSGAPLQALLAGAAPAALLPLLRAWASARIMALLNASLPLDGRIHPPRPSSSFLLVASLCVLTSSPTAVFFTFWSLLDVSAGLVFEVGLAADREYQLRARGR